ncbi:MCE family protein [Pimelobacter simplex]|uniref:MCE-family protein MceB n=1 Tax=Nocardioides simplex TaxID=2045 RepID=A0A0A1DIU8_NOCSI|nr:MlaD family protein [Pimelobacter simplex]AIY17316.1 MCE-family protein MceB [Pimelobacter simplex]MCG8151451.1 MCE family protein [Pimelobacter simplex]SFM45864.1 phospholipid/cholesterol/gamma-HCH transport system substrate-binding protein [Pimelobacter simplex]
MTGLRTIAIKFAAFAAVSGLLLLLLVNTMQNGVSGDTREFKAEFADVNGLRTGDDVKAAGVRVGQVTSIEATDDGAEIGIELVKDQPLLDTTQLVMRYQNLLGQRYIALVQGAQRGAELDDGAVVPLAHTDPGFDLTGLLNGFRPLFRVLQPGDVNTLASSLIKVLQGEGGTVEQLLSQTGQLSNFLADRDQVIGEVMTNLKPVLDNLAGQGDEITQTVQELRALMTGLAEDRKSIGASIDGVSRLVGATSSLLKEVKVPLVRTTDRLVTVADMLERSRGSLKAAVPAFATVFESLGRATSYESALNVYVCSLSLALTANGKGINPVGNNGPWSAVCK